MVWGDGLRVVDACFLEVGGVGLGGGFSGTRRIFVLTGV